MKIPPKIVEEVFEIASTKKTSLFQLSERSGYAYGTIKNMKQGRYSPRIDTLVDIGQALGLELTWKEKGNGKI